LRRCLECGLVFSDPQPRERVREKYLAGYDLAAHFAPMGARKRVLFERRIRNLPAPSPGRDRLCDVGCADGQFLEIAASLGWRPFGIEMNPPAAERARSRGATVFEGVFEEMGDLVPWGTFDLVTSWDALEHTPEPRVFAQGLVRLLRREGTVSLTTLNRKSLAWFFFRTRWSMVVEDHFTYWDRKSLTRLFESLGLRVLRTEIFGLGRDFVAFLDGARRGRDGATSPRPERGGSGWDVHPGVLHAEGVLNRFFDLFGGGVGIGMVFRRPEGARET
jgi:SAM-dependent methyltransferase